MAEFINERDAIRNLQKYLRQLGYFDTDMPLVPIDGIFESDTRDALMMFQTKNGLAPTGVADKETWDALFTEYLASLADNAPTVMIDPFPRFPEGYKIVSGDAWFLVDIVQHILEELRVRYDDFENVTRTGVYDAETERAIMDFQRRNSLPETGFTDKATWNELANQYNIISSDYHQ